MKDLRKKTKRRRGERVRTSKSPGLVSVFLAGVLSILLVMVLILTDLARISIAGAQMRTGLRLASNLALSAFDKGLAKEYGLFAIPDLDRAQNIAEEAFRRRMEQGEDHMDFLSIKEGSLKAQPLENARLSLPGEMEKQISSFMEWQSPVLVLEKFNEELKIFKGLEDLPPLFEAKSRYEKVLDEIQKEVDQCSEVFGKVKDIDPDFLSSEKDKIFQGFPPLQKSLDGLKKEANQLNETLKKVYEYSIDRNGDVNTAQFSEKIDPEVMGPLKGRFALFKKAYEKRREDLEQAKNLAENLSAAFDGLKKPEEKLGKSKEEWKKALKKLPPGMAGISFQTEYESAGMEENFLQFKKLKEELEKVSKEGEKQINLWEKVKVNGQDLSSMTFEDWMETINEKYRRGEFLDSEVQKEGDQESWEKDGFLSPQGQSAEKNLAGSSPSLRTKLREFLLGIKKKGAAIIRAAKVKIQANRAERAGLSHLAGSITEKINSEQMKRFEKDCHSQRPPALFSSGLADGSEEMMEEMIKSMEETGDFLRASDPVEDLSDHADLFLYWTHMFSCRTSKEREKHLGKPLLSLTSYPMNQRPCFGGELEYILYGRDQWMDNFRQASSRIFGMRLLANLVYAFSSREIFEETHAAALALVGWTGFGVPLLQSTLTFLLACGESWMDLKDLYLGKKVPIFKSEETWRFALSGIHKVAEDVSKDLFDDLESGVEGGADAVREMAKQKVLSVQKVSQEMVISALEKPIYQFLLEELISQTSENRNQASQTFDRIMERACDQAGDQPLGKAMKMALKGIQRRKNEVLSQVNLLNEEKIKEGFKTEELTKKAGEIAKNMAEEAGKPVFEKIDSVCNQWTEKADKILEGNEKKLEDQMGAWFKGFRKEMGDQGLDSGLAVSSGLSMDYEDYIDLLVWIRSSGSEKSSMLSNTARLIQAERGGIDLTLAPTSLKWQGQATVGTAFLGSFGFSSLSGFSQSAFTLKENWEEGYEKYKKEDFKKVAAGQ